MRSAKTRRVDAAGGCVMMHSDSATVGQRLTIEAAKAAAAGRGAGLNLPPEHIIQWVTSTPARALGLDDRIGTLAPGRNADIDDLVRAIRFPSITKADQVFIDGALAYDLLEAPQQRRGPDLLLGAAGSGGGGSSVSRWRTFIATALVLTCISARAETIAIVHAKAWTLTAATPVENATVV